MTTTQLPIGLRRELELDLHDLCQPLTTLQCQLELGAMCGDQKALMEAVEGGLAETAKMFRFIGEMRGRLLQMEQQGGRDN
jgi:hypothetical protein